MSFLNLKNYYQFMKRLVWIGVFLIICYVFTISFFRRASYTIQTEGILYIVNKLGSTVTVFDLCQGIEITELPIDVPPREIATILNPKKVVVTNYGSENIEGKSISLINTESNTIEKIIDVSDSPRPHGIIPFDKANKVGVVTGKGNHLLVIDSSTGVTEKKIPTEQIASHHLVKHPNKSIVYVTNMISHSITVIDYSIGSIIENIPCGLSTEGIDITPDGTEIWVANYKENTISVLNTDTYQITNIIPTGKESFRVKFSLEGFYCLVTSAGDGTITIYDRFSKKKVKKIIIPGKSNIIERILYHTPRPVGIYMHPNGLYAFVANSNANKVEVVDMKSFELVGRIDTGKVPDAITLVD